MINVRNIVLKIIVCLILGTAIAGAWERHEAGPDTADVRPSRPVISVSDSAETVSRVPVYSVPDSTAPFSSAPPEQPQFLRRLGEDFVTQLSSPFTMNGDQALWVGAGIGITAGLIMLDEPIDHEFRHLSANYKVIRTGSPIVTDFGGTSGMLTMVVYAGYSVIWNDNEAKETSMLLAEALITSGVWTRLGKMITGRERPSAAYEFSHQRGGRWNGLAGSLSKRRNETVAKYDAFPSGHTATAFALATVFARRYSESSYVPILSYSLATAVGLTRMIEHTHWASDVFAGACLGYLCADQVLSRYENEAPLAANDRPNRTIVRLSVGVLNESPALQLAIGF